MKMAEIAKQGTVLHATEKKFFSKESMNDWLSQKNVFSYFSMLKTWKPLPLF